jgi:tRNA-specific 2-thiouridylase
LKRYLVGLSGGADSAYAAALLKKRGFAVEGVYLKMFKEADPAPAIKTAEELGIPLHVEDCGQEFEKRVLCHFVDSYKRGRTPNPCVECNRYVKIRMLCDVAKERGISHVVTGHYASILQTEEGRYCVCRAENEKKDQSYVLWGLSQEQLAMLYLPLSSEQKEELRAALADALTQPLPVLYDIKVVPGTMTPGFENWWRVGVAEVSTQPRVQVAYEDLMAHVKNTREF